MDLWTGIHSVINEYEDAQTGKWFLMTSPFPLLVVTGIYLYLARVLPTFMENRKTLRFPTILIVYNIFQVLLSLWLFYGLLPGGLDALQCYPEGSEVSNHGSPIITKTYSYYFHLSKYTDLIDTILFILRKKYSQVTLLHVYHHSTMPFWTWVSVKYDPDGRTTFPAFLNSFVHIIMYTYYLLSALGPRIQRYLWWKKYVTVVQMMQFVFIILHTSQSIIYGCNVFKYLSLFNGIQATVYLALFYDFYKRSYKKRPTKKEFVGDCKQVDLINSKKCE